MLKAESKKSFTSNEAKKKKKQVIQVYYLNMYSYLLDSTALGKSPALTA